MRDSLYAIKKGGTFYIPRILIVVPRTTDLISPFDDEKICALIPLEKINRSTNACGGQQMCSNPILVSKTRLKLPEIPAPIIRTAGSCPCVLDHGGGDMFDSKKITIKQVVSGETYKEMKESRLFTSPLQRSRSNLKGYLTGMAVKRSDS